MVMIVTVQFKWKEVVLSLCSHTLLGTGLRWRSWCMNWTSTLRCYESPWMKRRELFQARQFLAAGVDVLYWPMEVPLTEPG